MPKKINGAVAGRAWNILRLALLWTRKGGVFKRRLITELRHLPKYVRGLGWGAGSRHDQIYYGERELSFDKTPIFNVKIHRPASMRFHLPCITPQVDFDYVSDGDHDNYDDEVCGYDDSGRMSFLKGKEEEDEEEMAACEEEGIDLRAEEFIAKFYEQMKLQRQISFLQYNEMQNRGTS
ncbi:hypothetical protein FH972_005842 [Carpinus fangiana]|uniref:Cotton fiber protein n=1 Tax=Carpinus fangiana TaxID=176857 RepID=A0A5N6QQG5_9ROSI|nr:hypothetical protein FH972_005842 [Carpinus fangiana]